MMKLKAIFFAFVLAAVLPAAGTLYAQQAPVDDTPPQWHTMRADNGEFFIDMPGNYHYFYDQTGLVLDRASNSIFYFQEMQLLGAAAEKTVMSVEIYKTAKPKSYLDELIDITNPEGKKTKENIDGFVIRTFELNKTYNYTGGHVTVNFVTKYIASKDHVYVAAVANRGSGATPAAQRFLDSMRLENAPAAAGDGKSINISKLTPVTIDTLASDERNNDLPPPAAPVKTGLLKPTPKPAPNPNALLMLSKPFPSYTTEARNSGYRGAIRIRVTFGKDGNISRAGFINTLPGGLARSALFAVLRIKFIPEEKDGAFINVTKTVEYSFDIR